MPRTSAGIALFRRVANGIELFLAHPGGPFWKNKDDGAWTFPKGEHLSDEDPLIAARREFREEIGMDLDGEFIDLGTVRQTCGKIVRVFSNEGDSDVILFSKRNAWSAVIEPEKPIDKRPNTWAVRYGDPEWKHFLDMWGAFLNANGEVERLFKHHMEKLGAA